MNTGSLTSEYYWVMLGFSKETYLEKNIWNTVYRDDI